MHCHFKNSSSDASKPYEIYIQKEIFGVNISTDLVKAYIDF